MTSSFQISFQNNKERQSDSSICSTNKDKDENKDNMLSYIKSCWAKVRPVAKETAEVCRDFSAMAEAKDHVEKMLGGGGGGGGGGGDYIVVDRSGCTGRREMEILVSYKVAEMETRIMKKLREQVVEEVDKKWKDMGWSALKYLSAVALGAGLAYAYYHYYYGRKEDEGNKKDGDGGDGGGDAHQRH